MSKALLTLGHDKLQGITRQRVKTSVRNRLCDLTNGGAHLICATLGSFDKCLLGPEHSGRHITFCSRFMMGRCSGPRPFLCVKCVIHTLEALAGSHVHYFAERVGEELAGCRTYILLFTCNPQAFLSVHIYTYIAQWVTTLK